MNINYYGILLHIKLTIYESTFFFNSKPFGI